MHYIYDAPGMLYFDVVGHLPDAWNNDGIYDFSGQGDGTFVYPGTPGTVSGGSSYGIGGNSHIPVASLRLKMLREGLEDYEYLKLCEAATSRANALSIANTVFPMTNNAGAMYTANNYPNSDPVGFANKLEAARDQLINCIAPGGPPNVTLAKSGTGTGRVTSSPAGIDCGSSCTSQSAPFASGTVVTLTATPDAGVTFGGFSGGCTSGSTTCTFTVSSSTTVSALFNSNTCTMSDCFDRANSSTLGTGWNTYRTAIEVNANQATNTDINSKASQFLTSVGADQDVSADCKVTGSGSNCGIMGRWSDANNHYYTYIDGGLGTIDLWRVQAGALTKIGSAARSIAFGTYYRLRLLIQGTQVSVYFANEQSAAISVADSGVTAGNYGGLHAFGGAAFAVWWDNFKIVAAPGGQPPLFSDNFNRTSGLGANWDVPWGPYTTDGAYAVSGTPPLQGNWAQLLPNLGTDNYAVVADIIIPSGSLDSGIVARSNDSFDFTDNLYSAQISTDGSVYLYSRNNWNWTTLGSYAAGIQVGVTYTLKLVATGSSPVHLEVWLNGTKRISYDDSPGYASGSVGMVNYDPNVKYDNFSVYQQ